MSEITKLYENAGIKKVKDYYCPNCETKLEDWFGKHKGYICPNERCDYALCDDDEDFQECLEHLSYREKYPPFTAEKQIELIKWLVKHRFNFMVYELTEKDFTFEVINKRLKQTSQFVSLSENNFEEGLAKILNCFWQDLTPEEQLQVKGILK